MFDTTDARCLSPTERKFPLSIWGSEGIPDEEVRWFCRACPLFDKCLDWAIRKDEYGVWAGTSRRERRILAAGKMRVKCPMCQAPKPWDGEGDQICAFCGFGWPTRRKRAEPAR